VVECVARAAERLRDRPSPVAAFDLAMKELKSAGHELWSWTPGEVWGSVAAQRGAGLLVTRYTDDVEEGALNTVKVEFSPREMVRSDDGGPDE